MPVGMDVEHQLRDLAKRMRREEDGKALKKDLTRAAREVLNPTRNSARSAIKSMPSRGHAGPKLRNSIASKVMVQIRPTGRFPGADLKAKKTQSYKRFRNAPKRTNSRTGWNHPAINNPSIKIHQLGKPGWFDDTTKRDRAKQRRAMLGVLKAAERRLRK